MTGLAERKKRKAEQSFIDGNSKSSDPIKLDPNAKRDYKSVNIPLNQWEYEMLQKITEKLGGSFVNSIRAGIRSCAREWNLMD